jgi:hypothetical protein
MSAERTIQNIRRVQSRKNVNHQMRIRHEILVEVGDSYIGGFKCGY